MAQTNWSCYGSSDGRNERPTMNVLQTEGERLHEQALSSYAHGNFAQAKLLLEKAIALEPYNASFRETKNSFCQANQGPYTYGHHQTGTGRSFLDGEQQKQQYGRGTATSWNSSLARQSWDSGGPQGSATFLNGNNYKARSVRGPWLQQPSGNAAQYFSNTVADSMFSPYWGRSEDFQSLGMNSHFGDPRASQRQTNVSYTGRTNVGPHYTKASNTSQQDGMWGTWTDPAAESDPKPEMSWVNSGYQQSDIPWTPEPRRAASLPNNIRSGANGSTSQSSLRGSMANSTERFSSKGHHGQSSPHTWRSEETSSETNYGLDSFDEVSNMDKVEEWMVRNEASGVPNPPPGLSKPRKNKKKKKKKMPAAPKQESPDTSLQTDKDVSQYSGRSSIIECQNPARTKSASARSCQSDETKSVSKNASYHSPSSKPRTAPFTAESVINSNSDKLSKHINDNPHHSKGFKEKDKSFFDPKRIFVSSDFVRTSQPSGCAGQPDSSKQSKTKSAVSKGEYNTSRKSAFSSKGRREGDGVKATGGSPEDLTNARTTGSRDQTYSCDPQETEADGLADDMERSRLDSSGSLGSEVSGRMTKEEWEEIIKRMYAPLGMPSSSPQEHPGRANGAPSEQTSWEQSPAFQNCGRNFVMPSNTEACALEGGLLPESETVQKLSKMKAGRVNAAEKGCSGSKQGAYVDVKATLGAGILQNSVPVCHADTSIRLTSPAGRQSKILSSEKCKTTESAQSAQASTSCQVPLTKGTGPVPQREKTSPENVNSSFAKPLEKPKVEVSSASSVISGRDATSSKGTSKSASNFSAEPKVEVCSTGLVTSSKVASGGDDVSPSKGIHKSSTKRSPEPRVEVSSAASLRSGSADAIGMGVKPSGKVASRGVDVSPSKGINKGSTKRSPEPKVEVSSAASLRSGSSDAIGIGVKPSGKVASRGVDVSPSKGTNKGSTKRSPEPRVEVSSAASLRSGSADASGSGVKPKDQEASSKGNKQDATTKLKSAQPAKPFWEPSRIFAAPKKDQDDRKGQVSAGESCSQSNKKSGNKMPLDQQTSNAKKDVTKKGCDANSSSDKDKWPSSTSSSETKESHCNPRASARGAGCNSSTLKPSDNSTSKRISQTKDLPLNSGTSYSYVAWRDQNAKRAMDAVKKSDPAASTETAHNRTFSSADSKSGRQSDAESVQNPGDRPTKVNVSQHTCEEPRLKSEAVTSEVPSESTFSTRGLGNKKSQCPSSGRHPEPTPDTASTHSQDSGLNFRSAPKDDRNRDGFSRTRSSSNEVPSAEPDVRAKESSKPRPMESKTRPDSGVAANSHPHQQRRAEGSTSRASQPGRPASDSASKSSRPGTAQGPRQQSSTRASAARAAPCAREDDAGTRPKDRKKEGTSPAGATTDNIDIEDVDPWYKWTRAIGRGLWWALCFAVFLLLILLACLYSTLKVGIKYSWHILRELVKLLQENWHSGRAYQGTSGGQGSRGSSSHGNRSRAPAEPTRSIDIPTSGGEAIKRLLRCNRDNPYEVLGVSSEASEDDIKKYYRRQCMLVHPDKNDLPAASEAFQILQKAYETLTDPVKRREFEMESQHAHFDEEMEDLMKKMEEKMEEVLNTLSCDVCGGKHRRYETNRDPYSARYCSRHGFRHPAHEGDVWVETSHLGFKWHFYAMMEDKIFDITEWAVCQDMKYMEPNSCEVRYRVGTQRSRSAPRQRAPPPGAHGFTNHHSHHRGQEFNDDMAEEMLKEFLRQFHQGDPRGGRAGGPSYGGGDASSQERGKKHKKHRKKKR